MIAGLSAFDASRLVVVFGYLIVAIMAAASVPISSGPRRTLAVAIGAAASAWLFFYMLTWDVSAEQPAVVWPAMLSRMAHLPTIGTMAATLILIGDAEARTEARERAWFEEMKNVVERV